MIKLDSSKELDRVIGKALVNSTIVWTDTDQVDYLIGIDLVTKEFVSDYLGDDNRHKSILIPYDTAILDSRLLIGEDVPFKYLYENVWQSATFNKEAVAIHYAKSNSHDLKIRIPKQWLQDNGMWEGE